MKHDMIVLTVLRHETGRALRSLRPYDVVWIVLGGGGLLAYGLGDIVLALRAGAAGLRQREALWTMAIPGAVAGLGLALGLAITGAMWSRAQAPFMRALPLPLEARRRMAVIAALALAVPLAAVTGLAVGLARLIVGMPDAAAWGMAATVLHAVGFAAGSAWRLAVADRDGRAPGARLAACQRIRLPWPRRLDHLAPSWLGAWAWNLPGGQVRPTWRLAAAVAMLGFGATPAIEASLARREAAPAAMAAILCGLLVFMASLRCHPLGSPVLRTAPIGFTRAWLRLLSLPAILSALVFVLPAGAALAAEPSAWATPVGSGVGLLALNALYGTFAAYFMGSPLAAALSFAATLAYAAYESLEYGRTILLAPLALAALLWHAARRRYYGG